MERFWLLFIAAKAKFPSLCFSLHFSLNAAMRYYVLYVVSLSALNQLFDFSLRRQIAAIDTLVERGLHFWDYGNAFLVECARAGADVLAPEATDDKSFKYPSYIQGIMGYASGKLSCLRNL